MAPATASASVTVTASATAHDRAPTREFLVDFVLGGLIIAVSGYFIRISNSKVGGFIYGALPIGFVYLYVLTYYVDGLAACRVVAREVAIATIFFALFVLIAHALTPFGVWTALAVSTTAFLVSCYVYAVYFIR